MDEDFVPWMKLNQQPVYGPPEPEPDVLNPLGEMTPAERAGKPTPWEQKKAADKTQVMKAAAEQMKAENNLIKATKERARLIIEPVTNKGVK
jgi:hypothetical protein